MSGAMPTTLTCRSGLAVKWGLDIVAVLTGLLLAAPIPAFPDAGRRLHRIVADGAQ